MGYVKALDNLPFILKIILALPFIDGIAYGIYRILKGQVILGILWLFFGAAIGWIIDIVSLLLHQKIVYLA